jgi:hypothetical protein
MNVGAPIFVPVKVGTPTPSSVNVGTPTFSSVYVGTPTVAPVNTGIPEQRTTPHTPVVMHNAQVQTSEDFNPDQKCVSSKCKELHSHLKRQALIHLESERQCELQLATLTTKFSERCSEIETLRQAQAELHFRLKGSEARLSTISAQYSSKCS